MECVSPMLTIIAQPIVNPDHVDEIKEAMLELVAATLKEEGCVRYELHQDNNQPNRFMFVETWESRELWRKHMDGDAVSQFGERAGDGVIECEILELTKVG